MSVLDKWINPYYLQPDTIAAIRETVWAKPDTKYTVLDSFFLIEQLDLLIEHHHQLDFSAELDQRSPSDGRLLPYDGEVCFARQDHFGAELFFDQKWHAYLATLTCATLKAPFQTEVKLRRHRPFADGFWIHSDAVVPTRKIVAICYFGKAWTVDFGGLLQLWRLDESILPGTFRVDNPTGRLSFLAEQRRIQTSTPGGGGVVGHRDFVLVDQIVPEYNRLFLCNFQHNSAFHSVTPSSGRIRAGFVQWVRAD